jgi:hypothetical protein
MKDDFAYPCRRRPDLTVNGSTLLGAGSGGDDGGDPSGVNDVPKVDDDHGGDDGDGGDTHYVSGTWERDASQVILFATDKPTSPTDDVQNAPEPIAILAASASDGSEKGNVAVRGNGLVRITSGSSSEVRADEDPEAPVSHPGIQMQVGNDQEIRVYRGTEDNSLMGRIEMSDEGIWADANQGMLLLTSKKMIKLQVAGGTSAIILTPSRVIVKGPIITLN